MNIKLLKYFLFLLAANAFAQPAHLQTREQNLQSLQAQILQRQQQLDRLKIQSDSLARLITPLKAKSDLSFFERRRLDALLRDSQQLAQQQEQTSALLNTALSQQTIAGHQLDSLYVADLDSLSRLIKDSARMEEKIRAGLLQQIALLQQKRMQVNPETAATSLSKGPALDSDDLPQDMENKADFLRDRADQLRSQSTAMVSRMKQVQKETTLRRRMDDFVQDMRVFDNQDETSRRLGTEAAGKEQTRDLQVGSSMKGETLSSSAPYSAEALLHLDFRTLPAYDLDEVLDLMKQENKKLNLQADSLAQKAEAYDNEARMLRNSLKNAPK
jgi:hypothetical protein